MSKNFLSNLKKYTVERIDEIRNSETTRVNNIVSYAKEKKTDLESKLKSVVSDLTSSKTKNQAAFKDFLSSLAKLYSSIESTDNLAATVKSLETYYGNYISFYKLYENFINTDVSEAGILNKSEAYSDLETYLKEKKYIPENSGVEVSVDDSNTTFTISDSKISEYTATIDYSDKATKEIKSVSLKNGSNTIDASNSSYLVYYLAILKALITEYTAEQKNKKNLVDSFIKKIKSNIIDKLIFLRTDYYSCSLKLTEESAEEKDEKLSSMIEEKLKENSSFYQSFSGYEKIDISNDNQALEELKGFIKDAYEASSDFSQTSDIERLISEYGYTYSDDTISYEKSSETWTGSQEKTSTDLYSEKITEDNFTITYYDKETDKVELEVVAPTTDVIYPKEEDNTVTVDSVKYYNIYDNLYNSIDGISEKQKKAYEFLKGDFITKEVANTTYKDGSVTVNTKSEDSLIYKALKAITDIIGNKIEKTSITSENAETVAETIYDDYLSLAEYINSSSVKNVSIFNNSVSITSASNARDFSVFFTTESAEISVDDVTEYIVVDNLSLTTYIGAKIYSKLTGK